MSREDRILHYSHGSGLIGDNDEPENKELKFNCRSTERAQYTLKNVPISYTSGKVYLLHLKDYQCSTIWFYILY